jgi:flagellar hook assembly protein FlgD
MTLHESRPNPFNPRTTLAFDLPQDMAADLRVYDLRGALVRTLVDADLPRGSHQASWDGCDASGRGMASGSYFARLEAGGRVETVRLSLVR